MLKKLLAQVRRLQFVADWLDFRDAKRESRKLVARYEADVKQRPEAEREHVWSEYSAEYRVIWEPIDVRRSEKLVARARKYGVPVPTHDDDTDWDWSDYCREWKLTNSAQEHIKREIRDEKREKDDEFRKWTTLVLSFAAFILALVSLTMKGKQPDQCPKNYYRNDQGECVFALQKASTPQVQQSTTPIASVQPKKPSPASPKP